MKSNNILQVYFLTGIILILFGFEAVAKSDPQLDASQFISLNCRSSELEVGDYCVDSKGKAAVVTGNPSKMVIRTLTKKEAAIFLTKNANTEGGYAAPDHPGQTQMMADQIKKSGSQRVPASEKSAPQK